MLHALAYQTSADIGRNSQGPYRYLIIDRFCCVGDRFGEGRFEAPLEAGEEIRIADAGRYTLVGMEWFNGLRLPAIVVERSDDSMELVKVSSYRDFKKNLG